MIIEYYKKKKGGIERLKSKVTTVVKKDHVIVNETSGGGGWGVPGQRNPELVRRDVIEGLISVGRARADYSVELNENTLEIDWDQTLNIREQFK